MSRLEQDIGISPPQRALRESHRSQSQLQGPPARFWRVALSRSRVFRCCHGQGLRVTRACPSGPALRLVLPLDVRLTRTANVTEAAGRRGQEEPSTARTTAPAEVLRHPARLGISLGLLPHAPSAFYLGASCRDRPDTCGFLNHCRSDKAEASQWNPSTRTGRLRASL